jgi:hypothetical protein
VRRNHSRSGVLQLVTKHHCLRKSTILFFSEKDAYRHAGKFKMFAQLILEVIAVGCFDIVGIVAKEGK